MGAKGIHRCSTADDEGGCCESISPVLFSFLVPLSELAARAFGGMRVGRGIIIMQMSGNVQTFTENYVRFVRRSLTVCYNDIHCYLPDTWLKG